MATNENDGKRAALIFGLCFAIYVLIIGWKALFPPLPPPAPVINPQPVPVAEEAAVAPVEEEIELEIVDPPPVVESGLVRKTQVFRGTDYEESVFYEDGKEIARRMIHPDGTIEQKGQIPDGKIKFEDSYNNTHGEENYLNGKKFGETKTYYSTGAIESEAKYFNDKLVLRKEYFANGKLRSEVNYENARSDQIESGIGKLYAYDGHLKFEWHLTTTDSNGFKKSYNKDGTLRAATYFDQAGNIIREELPQKKPDEQTL